MAAAPRSDTRNRGVLSLAVIAPVWGYSWVVMKIALDYSRPLTFIALGAARANSPLVALRIIARPPEVPLCTWSLAGTAPR